MTSSLVNGPYNPLTIEDVVSALSKKRRIAYHVTKNYSQLKLFTSGLGDSLKYTVEFNEEIIHTNVNLREAVYVFNDMVKNSK